MKRKGFTLIELLAVIVVLGIIMMIAVTAVTGIIRSSKEKTFKSSAMLVAKKIRENLIMTGETPSMIDCMDSEYGLNPNHYASCTANISYDGDKPEITVDLIGKGDFNGFAVNGITMDGNIINNGILLAETLKLTAIPTPLIYSNPGTEGGLYYWADQNKYIFRGGITITNEYYPDLDRFWDYYFQGTDDKYDTSTDINNYVKVPWEDNTAPCKNNYTSHPCWRIISVNSDDSITIVRDRSLYYKVFDDAYNPYNGGNHGYNDLLENPNCPGPDKYSKMYHTLYGVDGYQNSLSPYYYLLERLDVCLNKADTYSGLNKYNYLLTSWVTDTCDVSGKTTITTVEVPPFKNQYVRLPYAEEYLNASLQSDCEEHFEYECRGKNFMYNRQYYWCPNGSTFSTEEVMSIFIDGVLLSLEAYETAGVRPVVILKSTVKITGGDGSVNDPYIIKP